MEGCYETESPVWKDISHGKSFLSIATNPESSSIWAMLRSKLDEGYQIAQYNSL